MSKIKDILVVYDRDNNEAVVGLSSEREKLIDELLYKTSKERPAHKSFGYAPFRIETQEKHEIYRVVDDIVDTDYILAISMPLDRQNYERFLAMMPLLVQFPKIDIIEVIYMIGGEVFEVKEEDFYSLYYFSEESGYYKRNIKAFVDALNETKRKNIKLADIFVEDIIYTPQEEGISIDYQVETICNEEIVHEEIRETIHLIEKVLVDELSAKDYLRMRVKAHYFDGSVEDFAKELKREFEEDIKGKNDNMLLSIYIPECKFILPKEDKHSLDISLNVESQLNSIFLGNELIEEIIDVITEILAVGATEEIVNQANDVIEKRIDEKMKKIDLDLE